MLVDILLCEHIVGAGFLHGAVLLGHLCQELPYIPRIKLIGIQAHIPPVVGVHFFSESPKGLGTQTYMKRPFVTQPRYDLRIGTGQSLHLLPCTIRRTVVNDDNLIAPSTRILERSGDDIHLVLDYHQAVYLKSCLFHRSVYANNNAADACISVVSTDDSNAACVARDSLSARYSQNPSSQTCD